MPGVGLWHEGRAWLRGMLNSQGRGACQTVTKPPLWGSSVASTQAWLLLKLTEALELRFLEFLRVGWEGQPTLMPRPRWGRHSSG